MIVRGRIGGYHTWDDDIVHEIAEDVSIVLSPPHLHTLFEMIIHKVE